MSDFSLQTVRAVDRERGYLAILREVIEEQYVDHPTGCGASFGEILCWESHSNG